jgi:hypothetical protein
MEFKAKAYDVLEVRVIPEYVLKTAWRSKPAGDAGSTIGSKTSDGTGVGWR